MVNWNATGTFNPTTGGAYFGIADTGQTATFNMTGGSLNVVGAQVFLGNGQGTAAVANGTFNMSAGTVTVDASNAFYVGGRGGSNTYGTGVMNISGGYMYIAQGTSYGLGTSNAISMADGAGCVATISLTGGTLSTARTFIAGGGTATVNINGGVLQSINNSTGEWFDGGTLIVLGTNGGYIDVETGTDQIAHNAQQEVISGPGALIKLGPGTLALGTTANGNTYQGGTVINSGVLQAQIDRRSALCRRASCTTTSRSMAANSATTPKAPPSTFRPIAGSFWVPMAALSAPAGGTPRPSTA